MMVNVSEHKLHDMYYIVLYSYYTHIYTHDDPCHDAKARFMDFPCRPIQPLKTHEVTALQNLLTWEDVEGRTIIKGHLQILILFVRSKGPQWCAGTADRLSFSF
jgi:hypothetical protein